MSAASIYFNIQARRRPTNKISWRNHKRGQAKAVIGAWNLRIRIVEKQIQTRFVILRKVTVYSKGLIVIGI